MKSYQTFISRSICIIPGKIKRKRSLRNTNKEEIRLRINKYINDTREALLKSSANETKLSDEFLKSVFDESERHL